jgi:LmbE family N-acetylglucosaminyl deacetylase/chitodextrinase
LVAAAGAWLLAAAAHASVLVVAPHPDDDILAAAGVIHRAVGHEEVTVVFMTNGDVSGIAQGLLRQGEAVTAQVQHLGTTEDDLIFLGYPDGSLQTIYDSYTTPSSQYFTSFGQGVTYGNRGLGRMDYHSYRFGSPATYNRPNIVTDLAEILSTYRPSQIFTPSEFERHTDHATTYRLLRLALDAVHATDATYAPVVNRTIIWTPVKAPWPTLPDPVGKHTLTPYLSQTTLSWLDRASLDVPLSMQDTNLLTNLKYKAIQAHASEFDLYDGFLPKWAHKDEIFWPENPFGSNRPPIVEAGADVFSQPGQYAQLDGSGSRDPEGSTLSYRWTQRAGTPVTLQNGTSARPGFVVPGTASADDSWAFQLVVRDGTLESAADMVQVFAGTRRLNVAPFATVTASSQNTSTGQSAAKAIDGIADGNPGDSTREWATIGGRAGSWIRLAWSTPYRVDRVVLYDRPNLDDQVLSGTLSFGDGSTVTVGALSNGGGPVELRFAARTVSSLSFAVNSVSSTTLNVGLAEFRVYGGVSGGVDTTSPTVPTGLTATASSADQVNLTWSASTDNVAVAGYRVYRNGTAIGTTTTTSYSDTGLTASTLYTYRVSAYDGATPPNESAQSAAVSATTPSSSGSALRINTGSSSTYVDTQGRIWSADTGFNTGVMAANSNAIAGTLDDVLYQAERYDRTTAPELRYSLPVSNGTYEVRLHFAENYTGAMAIGARVFDVDIEGVRVFNDLDIFATVGARTALIRSATATVSDGRLDIDFLHQTENPLVNAIEIIGTGSTSDTTPPSVPTGVVATASSSSQVNLSWNASTDNVGVAGYRVFRNGVAVGTTTTAAYSDTGLAANTLYTYRVSAFDGASPANESAQSAAASVTTPSISSTALRINTGSTSAYVDGQGRLWVADTGFNTGVMAPNTNAIAGTVDDVLYQSERYDRTTAPELRYSLAVPNGSYEVRLHFAENYNGTMAVGARVFDVNIEGVRVFNDIDIFATVGARTALIRSATTLVSDGRLDIDFLHQTENPLVNAIEIIGTSVPDTTAPSVPIGLVAAAVNASEVTLAWNASTDNVGVAGYRVFRNGTAVGTSSTNSYSDTALAANTLYTYTVTAYDGAAPPNESQPSAAASVTTPATSMTVLRINAGSASAYVDSQARTWAADTGFNTGVMSRNSNAIAGTVDDVLYQSERWDRATAPELRYSLAVPNGTYEVRLHFAENYTGAMAVGARVFDVNIEGVRVFENIDVFATAGARTALVRSATTTVSDGRLDIDFLHQSEDPLVNAIEIIGIGTPQP